ncbi:hypothetical protein NPIL_293281 [Nephila pilipes]|uniref:Uncharacterized protein n=1 Tax=Nephila pilipes TaxID=299642 RepID=A0A8X6T3S8_NEPPI|nr:hypothetical protein NPIL_293281 [Nephila pilipes]
MQSISHDQIFTVPKKHKNFQSSPPSSINTLDELAKEAAIKITDQSQLLKKVNPPQLVIHFESHRNLQNIQHEKIKQTTDLMNDSKFSQVNI